MHAAGLPGGMFGLERARKTSRAGDTSLFLGSSLAAKGGAADTLGRLFERTARTNSGYMYSDIAVNESGDLGLGRGADLLGLHGAVLEEHQGRDSPYVVLRRGHLVLVDVELRDLEP